MRLFKRLSRRMSNQALIRVPTPAFSQRFVALVAIIAGLAIVSPARANMHLVTELGLGSWSQAGSGSILSGSTHAPAPLLFGIGFEQQVGPEATFSRELQNVVYGDFQHRMRYLPELRIQYADLTVSGMSSLSQDRVMAGVPLVATDFFSTDLELTQTDAIMFYRLFDQALLVDLGVAARWLDGSLGMATHQQRVDVDFERVVPMLYGRLHMRLPVEGFWLGMQTQSTDSGAERVREANTQVGWKSNAGFGLQAGWRAYRMTLDALPDESSATIDLSGPYATFSVKF